MSAVLDDNDNYHVAVQTVRPLRTLEALPFYSTEELLLGVCHIVPALKPRPTTSSKTSVQTKKKGKQGE